uniref:CTP synthase (glutamine hydrolyzing) n=1 Tax=Borrelia puertoricensis TaxID=2756107 RepID=A0AA51UNB9_9SPIR|nr:CTP synthase [Borrelia puertoricensis]
MPPLIDNTDVSTIYEIPISFYKQGLHEILGSKLKINVKPKVDGLERLVGIIKRNLVSPQRIVNIAICGKYTELGDSYASIFESLIHVSANLDILVKTTVIDSTNFDEGMLKGIDGVVVPGGFGGRGYAGKIRAIKYARENNIPFLGICLGMQLAVIEFARNVCGIFDADNKFEDAKNEILWFKSVFGDDFYLELQRHGIKQQDIVNEKLIAYSIELNVSLTVSNDSHYVNKEDATAQDIIVCIGTGAKRSDPNRLKMETNEFYLKTQEEMCKLFRDLPGALANTLKIAEKCDEFEIKFPGPIFPEYQVPSEFDTLSQYLEHLTLEGLKFRYANVTDSIKALE